MNWAAPEALLAELLATPAGLATQAVPVAARGALAGRGHCLVERGERLTLACAAVHFDPARFASAQHGRFGTALEIWETLDSTNSRAREAAAAGAVVGTVVLSETQTRGRGRHGRRWDCPAHAGLLFSLVLPAALGQRARPQFLPLALAIGAAEALRRATGVEVRLKWPNDLVLAEWPPRKLGGILLEAQAPPAAGVVAGCGLNVDVAVDFFARHDLPAAVSLATAVERPRREVLLAALLAGMEHRYQDWEKGRWSELLPAWEALDALQGRAIAIERGGERDAGTARGITPHGLLQLESADGTLRSYTAGEVHLR